MLTVSRLAEQGIIPAVKMGRGWRFRDKDLVDYLLDKHTGRLRLKSRLKSKMPEIRMPLPPGPIPGFDQPGLPPQMPQ